ncbi:hypothetical protein [uncultured Corynebacterium sp.]|uniref:hypothetical protein n=1 Tax=uncultured Corynebacterium sp. TaxID=159447 RepID=UPI0025D31251|nr:hypothetical protein [uncultured Corynebacterium sp.]
MTIRLALPDLTPAENAKQWQSAHRRINHVIARVLAMDPEALARVRQIEGAVDIFFSTPTNTIYLQRIPGTLVETGEGVVKVRDLEEALKNVAGVNGGGDAQGVEGTARTSEPIDLGAPMDLMWRGTLPPVSGYTLIDTPPGSAIRQLYQDMAEESREHSGPAGIARSLLDQEIMQVSPDQQQGDTPSVAITGRMIGTMGALGLAPEPTTETLRKYDYVRVSTHASWIRVDGLGGSLFAPRPGGLARVP